VNSLLHVGRSLNCEDQNDLAAYNQLLQSLIYVHVQYIYKYKCGRWLILASFVQKHRSGDWLCLVDALKCVAVVPLAWIPVFLLSWFSETVCSFNSVVKLAACGLDLGGCTWEKKCLFPLISINEWSVTGLGLYFLWGKYDVKVLHPNLYFSQFVLYDIYVLISKA